MKINIKQQGSTLIMSLMMLIVITIAGVSAVKISSIDTLIAGNEQQAMELYQETENTLTKFANTNSIYQALDKDKDYEFTGNIEGQSNKYKMTDSNSSVSKIITDTERRVDCRRSGQGTTIGLIDCRVYDFEVKMKAALSSAEHTHYRGMGKVVPKSGSSKGSIL